MTYFETINEMKNTINLDLENAYEAYSKTEAELASLIGEYVKGAQVESKALGTGKVINAQGTTLENLIVDIDFNNTIRRFALIHIMSNNFIKFADIFEIGDAWDEALSLHTQLTQEYLKLKSTADQLAREAKKKLEAEKKAEEKYQKLKEKAIQDFDNLLAQPKAEVSEVNEFYYALGWLTKHVGTIKAAIPDYLQTSFEQHFGFDANPYVVDSRKRTSGGFAFQWGIGMTANLRSKNLGTVPSFFTKYLNPTGKAITNTSFIWDLVDNYGFQFGKKQDVEKIKQIVPVKFISSYEAGLMS